MITSSLISCAIDGMSLKKSYDNKVLAKSLSKEQTKHTQKKHKPKVKFYDQHKDKSATIIQKSYQKFTEVKRRIQPNFQEDDASDTCVPFYKKDDVSDNESIYNTIQQGMTSQVERVSLKGKNDPYIRKRQQASILDFNPNYDSPDYLREKKALVDLKSNQNYFIQLSGIDVDTMIRPLININLYDIF